MEERLVRLEPLLKKEGIERLKKAHVAVFGLGGVGSWCAEALVRSGLGEISLVDQDRVEESNINRQILADCKTLSKLKTGAMAERLLAINPELQIHEYPERFDLNSSDKYDFSAFDYVADCIDTVSAKVLLIKKAFEADCKIISSMGMGNKIRAEQIELSKLNKTEVCPLARVMRRELKKAGVDIKRLSVVYSSEEPKGAGACSELKGKGRPTPASAVWVTGMAGFLMAQQIILDLSKMQSEA